MRAMRQFVGAAFTLSIGASVLLAPSTLAPAADAGAAPAATPPATDLPDILALSGINKKAEVCQVTPDERKFDRIGWSTTLLAAEKLAKENGRPVFLFTHDGRINTGRC
jgi:hypothetical protein